MAKFKIGDRVQFTEEALKTFNPKLSHDESRGTVRGLEPDPINGERLFIEFDDGKINWWLEAGRFQEEIRQS